MSNLINSPEPKGQLIDNMDNYMNQLVDIVDNFQSSFLFDVTILTNAPPSILSD